jgi:hypothetical protein
MVYLVDKTMKTGTTSEEVADDAEARVRLDEMATELMTAGCELLRVQMVFVSPTGDTCFVEMAPQ